jgi:outer membrane protein FlgP
MKYTLLLTSLATSFSLHAASAPSVPVSGVPVQPTMMANANSMPMMAQRMKKKRIIKVTAVGYGATSAFEGYTKGQQRLMAIRAAKLDGYRAIAEQIHGVRINGNTTVSAMMAKNDNFRVYIDAFIRGARVVSVTPMSEGNYETVMEIELNENFFDLAMNSTEEAGSQSSIGAVGAGAGYNSTFYFGQ